MFVSLATARFRDNYPVFIALERGIPARHIFAAHTAPRVLCSVKLPIMIETRWAALVLEVIHLVHQPPPHLPLSQKNEGDSQIWVWEKKQIRRWLAAWTRSCKIIETDMKSCKHVACATTIMEHTGRFQLHPLVHMRRCQSSCAGLCARSKVQSEKEHIKRQARIVTLCNPSNADCRFVKSRWTHLLQTPGRAHIF